VSVVRYKIPVSVLVVIYTPRRQTLLLRRADHAGGFWQSVTGSLDHADEPLRQTCAREVEEETGWRAAPGDFADWGLQHDFEIFPKWRHRYAPGVTRNREHVFGLLVPRPFEARLAPLEHTASRWLDWREAADACFSWTNAEALRRLGDLDSPLPPSGRGDGGEGRLNKSDQT
jgi:dihydroneopterin triphosphate diphosphatase